MDRDLVLTALFLGVASTYLLRAMVLREHDSHEGPFKSSMEKRYVRFETSGHIQAVALFDWIRRLFGAYKVNDLGEWVVYEKRAEAERWTCQFCASFWTSMPFSIGLTFAFFGASMAFLAWFLPVHFFIAIVSQICYRILFSD